jgi:2'-5' RNA ligase
VAEALEPLIVTLRLDEHSFARLDALRRAHFPPARNHIPAHATLFHHLPGAHREEIAAHLAQLCAGTPPVPIMAETVRFLGRGVAIVLASPPFERLRADLARHWSASLTPQDRQPFRPHVTVQNKVSAAEAQALYTRLQAEFVPFAAKGIGLCLWRYKGGPWEPLGKFRFTASDRA